MQSLIKLYNVKLFDDSVGFNSDYSTTDSSTTGLNLSSDQDGSGQKEGKLFFPLPIGIYQYTPNQPLPLGSLLALAILIIIPFIPFGAIEITFALGWDANYLVLRLNG